MIPRQHEATRYELRNGIALCSQHHKFDADMSPHQNAAGWILWLYENQRKLHDWYIETDEFKCLHPFDGIKNATYYIDVILRLKEYVDESDYTRIVGVNFAKWLKEEY